MGLFDIFKSKTASNNEHPEEYTRALEKYNEGNYQEALGALVGGFRSNVDYKPFYELAILCLDKLGGGEESRLFKQALNNFNSSEAYKNLGAHFFGEEHYDLSLPFYKKALTLNPSDSEVAHDLAIVLSRRFQIKEAVDVLESSHPQSDFWNYWFWCKLKLLAGEPSGVEEGLNELSEILDQQSDQEAIKVPREKLNEVIEMLKRFKAVESPKMDIQDWHFIQYGGVILDYFDETDDFVAGGRYVALWGGNETLKNALFKLETHLHNCSVSFERVFALTDRNSYITGLAVALLLDKPLEVYSPGINTTNSIIVAANTSDFNDYPELENIELNQVTFALNHNWLTQSFISPDIVGFMTQMYSFPWEGGGLKVNPDTDKMEQMPADERPPVEIAQEIHLLPKSETYDASRLDFYVKHIPLLKGSGNQTSPKRWNFMIESPVPGSYFG